MTDPGLYNYIKSELTSGKTKEQINTSLMQGGGWTQVDIDTAFSDVQSGNIPTVDTNKIVPPINKKATIALIMGVIILLSWVLVFFAAINSVLSNPYVVAIAIFLSGCALVGMVFAILGFKMHKVKALVAIVFCFIGLVPALITALGAYKLSKISPDIAAIDESALKISPVNISDSQNSHFDLIKLKGVFPPTTFSKFATDYLAVSNPSKQQIDQAKGFLAGDKAVLKLFDDTASKPYYYCTLEGSDNDCNLNNVRDLARFEAINADIQFRDGKYKESFDTSIKILSLGQKIQNNSINVITYLVGIAVKQIALKQANLVLSSDKFKLSPADKLLYTSELAKYTDNETGQKNALKGEYAFITKQIDVISSPDQSALSQDETVKLYADQVNKNKNSALWQPNNTKLLFYNAFINEVGNVDKPCGSSYLPNLKIDASKLSLTEGNYIGKILYSISAPSLESINKKRCDIIKSTEDLKTGLEKK